MTLRSVRFAAMAAMLALAVAALLSLAARADAASPAPSLGPAPVQSDCLSWHSSTQGCYYDVGFIDATISSHLLRVGQHFTITSTGTSAYGPWSWYHPPNSTIVSCTPAASGTFPQGTPGKCEYVATAPTNGWVPSAASSSGANADSGAFFGAALHCCTIGTYIDGDFFAIAGPHLDGFVTDADGDPVENARISISGTTAAGDSVDYYTDTQQAGYYHALLADGTYTVRGSAGGKPLCLKSFTSFCKTSTSVTPDATLDFRTNGFAEVAGTVKDLDGQPVDKVVLDIADDTGAVVAHATTRKDGSYQADLDKAGTYRVTPKPAREGSLFEPDHTNVNAQINQEVDADFKLYEPLKVTIESGQVNSVAGDSFLAPYTDEGRFDLQISVTNKSPNQTITDLAGVNLYGVQVAPNAFPPEQTGAIFMRYISDLGNHQTSLAPGETYTYYIQPQARAPGLVALRAKFTGKVSTGSGDKEVSDTHDAQITIKRPEADDGLKFVSGADGVGLLFDETSGALRDVQRKDALQTYKQMHLKLDASTEKQWFGSANELQITDAERAIARQSGLAPEQVAIAMPNEKGVAGGKNLDTVDQFALYGAARNESDRKTLNKWWGEGGGKVIKDIAYELRYWSQVGSAEGRLQIASHFDAAKQGVVIDKNAMIDAFFASPDQTRAALSQSVDAGKKFIDALGRQTAIDSAKSQQELADAYRESPAKAQKILAERDSELSLKVADQMFGDLFQEGVLKVGSAVVKGTGTGLFRAAALLKGEVKTADQLARETRLGDLAKAGLPTYFDELPEEARVAIGLDKMRAMGGISGRDANIARRHVETVNGEIHDKFGPSAQALEMALVGRPVNPFEAPGSFAKVEAVGVKSVNPEDLLLGAHPKALGQPAIFNPRDPTELPGWKDYSAADQFALQERFNTRQTEFLERHGTAPPDSKMYDMKRAIGKKVDITFQGGNGTPDRVYSLKLGSNKVTGGGYEPTEILSYEHLEINGDVLYSGKPRPIGTDFDKVGYIDRKTGDPLPAEIEDYASARMNELGRQSALTEGYSEPFHGETLRRLPKSDLSEEGFLKFGHYGLTHLPEAKARQVAAEAAALYNKRFPDRTPVTADDVLKKVHRFNAPAILVTTDDVIFGPLQFVDP